MDQNLLKNLNKLKEIQPDPEYIQRSRFLILSSSQSGAGVKTVKIASAVPKIKIRDALVFGLRKPALAAIISGVLMLIIFLSVSYFNQILSPIFLPGFDKKDKLVVEADEITASIRVRLDDVKYNIQELENKNLADLATLNKLRGLLAEATNKLKEASESDLRNNKDIELSLQKMKAANEILKEMSLEINKSLTK